MSALLTGTPLTDRVAVITGASSGIGEATARHGAWPVWAPRSSSPPVAPIG